MRLDTNLGFEIFLVDDHVKLRDMLDIIGGKPNRINVDFEGINLSKNGRVCLGQVHVSRTDVVYVVDFVSIPNPFEAFCVGSLNLRLRKKSSSIQGTISTQSRTSTMSRRHRTLFACKLPNLLIAKTAVKEQVS